MKWHYVQLMAVILIGSASQTEAQPAPPDVTHDISWKPKGNIAPKVDFVYYCHAWAIEKNPDDQDDAVNPGGQPAGFKPFGKDNMSSLSGKVSNGGRPVNKGSTPIPPAGTGAGGEYRSAFALCNLGTYGWGNVTATVDPFNATSGVTGSVTCHTEVGLAAGPPEWSDAYAFSQGELQITARYADKRGRIRMGQKAVLGRGANAAWGRGKTRAIDPIHWRLVDAVTGDTREGRIMHMEAAVENGFIDWRSGPALVNLFNGKLMMVMDGTYTTQSGELWLEVTGGVVTRSDDSGIFDGMLPPVGSAGLFPLTVPSVDFDFDFNGVTPNDADITFSLGGGSEIEESDGGLLGTVALQGYQQTPDALTTLFDPGYELELRLPGTQSVVHRDVIQPDVFGDWNLWLPYMGAYDVSLKGAHFLRRTFRMVQIMPVHNYMMLPALLINGDCDGDNVVTVFDYSILSDAFDSSAGDHRFDPRADLDGDRSVTVFDYSLLSDSFDLGGDQ